MADSHELSLPTFCLLLTALLLSLVVLGQIASTYVSAYLVAPSQITSFIDAVDFSIQENESYDLDVAKVQKLDDKLRLGKLLRDIQRSGDDLREILNELVVVQDTTRLRPMARLLWRNKRAKLEEGVRRSDMLRTRFLVVYMGIIAMQFDRKEQSSPRDPEKTTPIHGMTSKPHPLAQAIQEGLKRKPPLRRLTTQAMGHAEKVDGHQRQGWMGVMAELQSSPLMHKRHASIEAKSESPKTPR